MAKRMITQVMPHVRKVELSLYFSNIKDHGKIWTGQMQVGCV